MLAIVVFLAIRTRKVKMRGLDDSKFVIASTYATSIFMIPTQISYVLLSRGFLNAFIVIFGGNIFIATTTTLSLVFVPKVKYRFACKYTSYAHVSSWHFIDDCNLQGPNRGKCWKLCS